MEIIEENQNPPNSMCTGKPEKLMVDWVCPNQKCEQGNVEKNGSSNFVDGGGVYTPAKVKFTCFCCGASETTMVYTDYKTESKAAS